MASGRCNHLSKDTVVGMIVDLPPHVAAQKEEFVNHVLYVAQCKAGEQKRKPKRKHVYEMADDLDK